MSKVSITRSWSMLALIAVVVALLTVPATGPARADQPAQDGLLVNGPNALVTSVAHDPGSGRSYVAGDFTRWGPQTGGMAVVNNTTGTLNSGFPAVLGFVRAAVPDSAGGFYIGGTFSHVGGVARNNAAHILADGTVDPNWNPNPQGTGWDGVVDMALIGSDVVLAGRFQFGGQTVGVTRVGPDGARAPGFSDALLEGGSVYSVATDGSTIYAVGDFDSINSTARGDGAALNAATGALQSWNPAANDGAVINAVELMDDSIVIGGDFSTVTVGAVSAPNMAAFATADGSLKTGWIPAPDARVTAMAVAEDGSQLYLAGEFSTVAGSSRSWAAGLESDTDVAAVLTGWAPEVDGLPFSVRYSHSGVYLTGLFTQADGHSVPGIARVTADTGSLDAGWDPPDPAYSTSGGPEYVFLATPLAGSQVLIGGTFTVMGGSTVNRVAALDVDGDLVTSFSVGDGPNARVNALTLADGKLILGGSFSSVDGAGREQLAAVDPTTGDLDGWASSLSIPDGAVYALASEGSELFLGGSFTEVGGQARNGIAGIDVGTGTATGWGANALVAGADVRALAATNIDGTRKVYAGGYFERVGGGTNFAGLEGADGTLIGAVPDADGWVLALSISGERVYLGGSFANVGGVGAPNVAAVNAANDTLEVWDGAANSGVQALNADADQVIVGGPFDVAFGLGVAGLGAGTTDAAATGIPWNVEIPSFGDGEAVRAMQLVPDADTGAVQRVLIGADTAILDGAQLRLYFADVNSGIAAGPPRNVRAVGGGESGLVDLSWEVPSTLGPGISEPVGYRIWSSSPPYTTWSLANGNTEDSAASAVISGLTDSTRYRFRVAALTDQGDPEPVVGGRSAPSNWAMPQNPSRRPSAPQNVSATGEPDGATGIIRVLADAPTSWGSGTAKGYRAIASVPGTGIPMGYCQDFAVPASLDCYITALTLGSDYDVMAKAVNSQNVWGPSAAAVENPIDAQSFERPTSPEPLDGPGPTDEPLAPGLETPDPSPERITTPRATLAKSAVTNLRIRAVKQTRGKRAVVVRAKVRPAAGRVVQLQRKVCTTQSDQRMCVWKTVGQRRAKAGHGGHVLFRSKRTTPQPAAWRVFLPATGTALPAVSRTVRR